MRSAVLFLLFDGIIGVFNVTTCKATGQITPAAENCRADV